MLRAVRFDARLYQELRADPTATWQAFGVILLSGLSLGFAGILGFYWQESLGPQVEVLARCLIATLAGWVVVSLLGYWPGQLLNKTVTFPSMLRAIGFANAPGILYIFIMVGGTLALWINAVLLLWVLVGLAVALQHTLRIHLLPGLWLSIASTSITIVVRNLIT